MIAMPPPAAKESVVAPTVAECTETLKDAEVSNDMREIQCSKPSADKLVVDQSQSDVEACQRELEHTKQQLAIQNKHANTLARKVVLLERNLQDENNELRQKVDTLTRELVEAENIKSLDLEAEIEHIAWVWENTGEREGLIQRIDYLEAQLEHYSNEAKKWKHEAFARGTELVETCLQHRVAEGVRKERKKDVYLVKNLSSQIKKLEAEKAEAIEKKREAEEDLAFLKYDAGPKGDGKESLLVKCLRAEIALLKGEFNADKDSNWPW